MAPPVTPKFKFSEGEKVLCFHGPLIYEAKCLKSSVKDKQIKYFIHYAGWNKNWDEWVPESRVLKYNETNLARQKEVQTAHQHSSKSKSTKNQSKSVQSSSVNVTSSPASMTVATPSSATANITRKQKQKDDNSTPSGSRSNTPNILSQETKLDEKSNSVSSIASGSITPSSSKLTTSSNEQCSTRRASTPRIQQSAGMKLSRGATATTQSSSQVIDITKDDEQVQEGQLKKKQKIEMSSVQPEQQFLNQVEIKIRLPEELQRWLIDDWDSVVRKKKLFSLPAKLTVEQILSQYIDYKSKQQQQGSVNNNGSQLLNGIRDLANGVKEYFDVMLGTQLLYKFERPQYSDILHSHPNTPMSQIYGGAHLLRLFCKLGPMLAYTPLDQKPMQLLMSYFNDFFKFLIKHTQSIFSLSNYENVGADYLRKAQ